MRFSILIYNLNVKKTKHYKVQDFSLFQQPFLSYLIHSKIQTEIEIKYLKHWSNEIM